MREFFEGRVFWAKVSHPDNIRCHFRTSLFRLFESFFFSHHFIASGGKWVKSLFQIAKVRIRNAGRVFVCRFRFGTDEGTGQGTIGVVPFPIFALDFETRFRPAGVVRFAHVPVRKHKQNIGIGPKPSPCRVVFIFLGESTNPNAAWKALFWAF